VPIPLFNLPIIQTSASENFSASQGGGPTTQYAICRNADNGDCYYKKTFFEQIPGCDPEVSDENPYGKEECFKSVANIYGATGNLTQEKVETYRQADNCGATTQQYFDSKVN
jgi:hypothetical protein